jgi:hypothetical protein
MQTYKPSSEHSIFLRKVRKVTQFALRKAVYARTLLLTFN